jgi:hypothetical protein
MTGSDDEFEDFLRRRKPIFRPVSEDPLEPPGELDRLVLRQAREAIEDRKPVRVFGMPRWGTPVALAATLLISFTIVLNSFLPTKKVVPEVTVQNVAQRMDYRAAAPAERSLMREATPTADSSAPATNQSRHEERAENSSSSEAMMVDLAAPSPAKSEAASSAPTSPAPMVAERRRSMADSAAAAPATPGFVSQEEADRYSPAPSGTRPAANPPMAGVVVEDTATGSRTVITSVQPPPTEAEQAMAKASAGPAWRRDTKTWLAEIERLRAEGKTAQADVEYAEYKRQHRAYAVAPDR